MPLESGNLIPDLDANNPLGADPKSEGDDHLRLVKRCVLGSFPGFVGTTAVPKSVTLTEDQINDAALKSEVQTISGQWTHSASVTLANDVSLRGTESGATARGLIKITTVDVFQLGNSQIDTESRALGSESHLIGGTEVADFVSRAAGSLLLRDINGGTLKAAFRNPGSTNQNDAYTFVQADEGQIIRKTSGVTFNYTVPQLEAGTTITVLNDSANNPITLIEGAGVSMDAMVGGAELTAPLTVALGSVVQLYWVNATTVKVWGGGISN